RDVQILRPFFLTLSRSVGVKGCDGRWRRVFRPAVPARLILDNFVLRFAWDDRCPLFREWRPEECRENEESGETASDERELFPGRLPPPALPRHTPGLRVVACTAGHRFR